MPGIALQSIMELMKATLRRGEAVGQSSSASKNFKVAVRVRPLIDREWEAGEAQVSGVIRVSTQKDLLLPLLVLQPSALLWSWSIEQS